MGDGGLLETDKGDDTTSEEGPEEDICFLLFKKTLEEGGVGGNYRGKVLSGVSGSGKGMGQ